MPAWSPHPWNAPALRRALLLTVLLATVVTLHTAGGLLLTADPALGQRLVLLGHVWVGHCLACGAMLAVLAWRYPHVPRTGSGRGWALARLVMWTALVGLLVLTTAALARLSDWRTMQQSLSFGWLWNLSLSTLLVLGYDFAQRSRVAADTLHEADLRRLGLARELDSARLQLLRAQVEPHFLFNALANVRRLLRTDPPSARTLLGDLLRYLQEALPALRNEHSTLGREAELVRAFLAVHQVRMGARLQMTIDIPAELADRAVPPMVLLTLVENALKHGLQPLVGGGSIQVGASRAGGRLVLRVADTGRGMGSGSGGGTGLANLRALLRSMYGQQASLALAVNEPHGVVVTVQLPDPGPDGAS